MNLIGVYWISIEKLNNGHACFASPSIWLCNADHNQKIWKESKTSKDIRVIQEPQKVAPRPAAFYNQQLKIGYFYIVVMTPFAASPCTVPKWWCKLRIKGEEDEAGKRGVNFQWLPDDLWWIFSTPSPIIIIRGTVRVPKEWVQDCG